MPYIAETVVTTSDAEGNVHIAPLGLIKDDAYWIIAPFKPSRTLDNLRAVPFAAASQSDDVRVIAGCVTGRKDWPVTPTSKIPGGRLSECCAHWELKVERIEEHEQRPRFFCKQVHIENHAPWMGFNRAKAAVLELAVLTTRLKMLPPEKVESELKYLEIAISKTAGPAEQEAWGWLMEKVDRWQRERAN